MPSVRWPRSQVVALAPRASVWTAALPLVDPSSWAGLGCDADAVWGRYRGTAAEPYDVVAHHRALRSRCTCPSSLAPCKHVLALLALWTDEIVVECDADRVPSAIREWCATIRVPGESDTARPAGSTAAAPDPMATGSTTSRGAATTGALADDTGPSTAGSTQAADPTADRRSDTTGPDHLRPDRVARMLGGLDDLLRWLDDAARSGVARPEYRDPATFEEVAARLVDAQVGGLANRVRRFRPPTGAQGHDALLAEMACWHLVASAGLERDRLPDDHRDTVDLALGWQVRQADVLALPAETDDWIVMGRSDRREDRIDVRRTWVRAEGSGRWAVLLSFAAGEGGLDDTYAVGSCWSADLHRYPGRGVTRALVGRVHSAARPATPPPAGTLAEACRVVSGAVADEPWVERVAVHAAVSVARTPDGWALTDPTGSLPLAPETARIGSVGVLLACSADGPVDVTAEWTPDGLVPLTVWSDGRAIDVGPVTDRSGRGAR